MITYNVKVNNMNKCFEAEKGTLLSDFLLKNGFETAHPCGGKGICKKCSVTVNGRAELSCQYRINSDIEISLPESKLFFSSFSASGISAEANAVILDIGTTTLELGIADKSGKIIYTVTEENPQKKFGADVISRIEYCSKHGAKELQSSLTGKINEMLSLVIELYGNADKLPLFVCGNTVMLHLFLGVDCSGMGKSPYTPAFLESKTVSGNEIGLCINSQVTTLPNISAFAGADIFAGLIKCKKPAKGKYNLLADLGTNSEIVLYSENGAICTSAAAGPCFEGVNISCGMTAREGAIKFYYRNGTFETIGDKAPVGICATGLVDIIAFLLKNGFIDETGAMRQKEFQITEDISVTQEDIRNFQLAKSAIYSGITALISKAGISFDEIENLFVSGGFSQAINTESAVKVGLFPKQTGGRIFPLNNTALLGTALYSAMEQKPTTDNIEYISLSGNDVFENNFIKNLNFNQ